MALKLEVEAGVTPAVAALEAGVVAMALKLELEVEELELEIEELEVEAAAEEAAGLLISGERAAAATGTAAAAWAGAAWRCLCNWAKRFLDVLIRFIVLLIIRQVAHAFLAVAASVASAGSLAINRASTALPFITTR